MTNAHNNNTKNGSTSGTRRGKRRGFTLIEILIVVVILGVLAALVIPGVTSALSDANASAAEARASQITTMLVRYKQFVGKDDTSVNLTVDRTWTSAELEAVLGETSTAKYCADKDLENQVDATKGWVWNSTEQKFRPES